MFVQLRVCSPSWQSTQSMRRSLVRLSSSSAQHHYTTTPIFYVNAVPHIGHLHSIVLADVLHRYATLQGKQTLLSTGTDEHGLKIQQAAAAASTTEAALCDSVSQRFRELAQLAHLDKHDFIRTTETRHKLAVQHIWNKLAKSGHIYKGSHSGWYAVSDEAFYPENGVHDVLDEKSGKMVKVSKETGRPVEWVHEENYKFKLSSFQDKLIEYLSLSESVKPEMKRQELLTILHQEKLADLSISRPRSRLHWGIPVPGDESHTIYVWFDALVNYLAVTGYPWTADPATTATAATSPTPSEKAPFWPASLHIVGKDILRFHAIYWPAILFAAGLEPPKSIISHAHWTMQRQKMSKSIGNVVDPMQIIHEYGGIELLRFYLMRIGGGLEYDSDFSFDQLGATYKRDLMGQLGNLYQRTCNKSMFKLLGVSKEDSGRSWFDTPLPDTENHPVIHQLEQLPDLFKSHMDNYQVAKALSAVFDVLSSANIMLSEVEPWQKSVSHEQRKQCILICAQVLRMSAICLQPFIPQSATTLLDRLGVPVDQRSWGYVRIKNSGSSPSSSSLGITLAAKDKTLFPRIDIIS